jgi:DUF4097 and DUF4098 domain-containing protein YvlB
MTDTENTHVFETPGPAKLRIEIPNGRIRVTAGEMATTRIKLQAKDGDAAAREWIAEAEVGQVGDEIVVRGNRSRLHHFRSGRVEALVEAPIGSAADLSTGAGDIEASGRLGRLSATTGSGDVTIAECAEGRARTGSGDIRIERSGGGFDAKSGSGDVRLGKVDGDVRIVTGNGDATLGEVKGAVSITAASGDIAIEAAGASVEAFSASGDVKLRRASQGRVRARTVSGDVSVGVPAGLAALLDIRTLTGSIRSELQSADAPPDGEGRVELVLNTVSGDVTLKRV